MDEQPQSGQHLGAWALPLLAFLCLSLGNSHSATLAVQVDALVGIQSGRLVPQLVGTFQWLSGGWLISHLLSRLVVCPMVQRRTGAPAPSILTNSLTASIFIVTFFAIIRLVFDRPIGGLVATSGVVTLVIGFAVRDMIADFFSGLAMNLEHPYRIGDWLELGPGQVARVTEQNWRATRLVSLGGRTLIVPNNDLASRQFTNLSLPDGQIRESLQIVLNYTGDPARIENILLAAILATDGPVKGAPHQVRITGFSERGVSYQIRYWVGSYEHAARVRHAVAAKVLDSLNQAGVAIPYGQQEVLLTRERRARQDRRVNARQLLSRIEWLEALDEQELTQLATVALGREFPAGTAVMREGETGTALYVLVEGVAVVGSSNGELGESTIGQIQPGQAFGEISMLTGAARVATVTALTDLYTLEVRREDLEPIMRARPDIANELGRVMARRMMLNRRKANRTSEEPQPEDLKTKALQLARKISALFSIHHTP